MTSNRSSDADKSIRRTTLILGTVAFAFYFGFILVGVLHA